MNSYNKKHLALFFILGLIFAMIPGIITGIVGSQYILHLESTPTLTTCPPGYAPVGKYLSTDRIDDFCVEQRSDKFNECIDNCVLTRLIPAHLSNLTNYTGINYYAL